MSKYLELPRSLKDTIENLKELKEVLQEKLIIINEDEKGEKDAEEIAFDFDRAIKELEEIQQYNAIGTVEECRAAVEKQKAVKPVTYKETNIADCPVCGATVRGISKKFGDWCSKCGQKLDWSEEE